MGDPYFKYALKRFRETLFHIKSKSLKEHFEILNKEKDKETSKISSFSILFKAGYTSISVFALRAVPLSPGKCVIIL